MIKYSWILPVKNEDQSLPQLITEIGRAMKKRSGWEIIAINDGSEDLSPITLTYLSSLTPQLKLINFRTAQGKWAALRAGFEVARGRIIITSDSDLQDDPLEVNKLLAKINHGFDLVSGWRKIRYDSSYKRWISRFGNQLAAILSGQPFLDLNSSFKVYKREVLAEIPKHGSLLRFSLLFAKKLGFKVCEVSVNHRPRTYGKSKFGLVKYLRIIYDLILVMLLFTGSGRVGLDSGRLRRAK
ncbi:hypothetical protein A3B45_04405 [Candidatus Daviesbacteria bacterium RIFCSPLOWO2_01_FULL_39_12]|uniref:Glycosyltransferase 2-like domain-containing protein n=1 Tax=Candidatus Daviesbacteria bacterium RIFCSPLOWO2_01_FULL_39_12 TaxID=1797785 RepID=A0A1F5KNN4_9BACT|nr:MAG: hypothetical protein A3B45_04405 [Candidatus Daviesbacteria bacterium RIFCSPLOWO2_01_FULL_39_12]